MLVKGLTFLNEAAHRDNVAFDKPFIKALLIGICTSQKIKKDGYEGIHGDLLKFIRELFIIRIESHDADGNRYLALNSLVVASCNEISNH